ncbi:MAG TPA: DUF2269 family protein [Thermoleophilaceae bacterium]|jgi:uncharacterized membrane protein|nr:DUF2269 family protein [Thermoleophilaceae bacterium]
MFVATLYQWLFLLHIVAAMVWLGGAVFVAALAARALRSDDAAEIGRFVRGLRTTAPIVLAPAAVTVAGFGVWLVLNSAAWSFDQRWVQVALGLFAVSFLIGAAYLSRRAIAAERAADAGDARAARRQLRGWARGYGVILTLLLVTTWDMVFKPGL